MSISAEHARLMRLASGAALAVALSLALAKAVAWWMSGSVSLLAGLTDSLLDGAASLLNLLARLGSGFDIVSGGELSRVLAAGGDPAKVVFSGVAKSEAEMRLALEKEILCFNLESEAELERLNRVAGSMGKKAREIGRAHV